MKKKFMLIVLVVLLGAGAYWGYLRYWEEPAQGLEASGTIEATQVQLTASCRVLCRISQLKRGSG